MLHQRIGGDGSLGIGGSEQASQRTPQEIGVCGPDRRDVFADCETMKVNHSKAKPAIGLSHCVAELFLALGHRQQAGLSTKGEAFDQGCFACLRIQSRMGGKRIEDVASGENSRQSLSALLEE
jgi:hypothetical protein